MRTRDVFIEICPECNTLHMVTLKQKAFPNKEPKLVCKMTVDFEEPKENEDPVPIECGHEIELSEEHNVYTVKRWTFKERSTFYQKAGIFKGTKTKMTVDELRLTIDNDTLNWVIRTGSSKLPVPITEEAIGEMDGAIAEALFGSIMTFNMPPLGRSSVSR